MDRPKASGLQSLAWRRRWEMTGNDELKRKLIVYNSEDCRALKQVTEALETIGQGQQSVEGSTPAWEEVKFEPTGREWGTIRFVLPDFNYINKCAYFDYPARQAASASRRPTPKEETARWRLAAKARMRTSKRAKKD